TLNRRSSRSDLSDVSVADLPEEEWAVGDTRPVHRRRSLCDPVIERESHHDQRGIDHAALPSPRFGFRFRLAAHRVAAARSGTRATAARSLSGGMARAWKRGCAPGI